MPQNDIMSSQNQTQLARPERSSLSRRRAAREALLLCITTNISPRREERISQVLAGAVDWQYLLDLAGFHGVTPLIAHNLTNNGLGNKVPQPYLERLRQIYNNTLYRNMILSDELIKVLSALSQHGISVITLKGTILSEQLYGNPGLRIVADMDLLVQPEELSLAGSLLLDMGYHQLVPKQAWKHAFHEVPYCKQGQFPFFIELHWDLDDQKLVAVPRQEIWRRAQPLQLQGGSTMVLSPEDTLVYLSKNLSKQDDQLLRSLCDITELLKKYQSVLDWDYIVESANNWGIGTGVYYSLMWAQDLLGAPVPASLIRALKPKVWRRWALEFLLSQETFVSSTRPNRLRNWTIAIVNSLTMKHVHQTLTVLSKNCGYEKRAIWLRTAIWVMLVFSAALGRNVVGFLSGWRWRVSVFKD